MFLILNDIHASSKLRNKSMKSIYDTILHMVMQLEKKYNFGLYFL